MPSIDYPLFQRLAKPSSPTLRRLWRLGNAKRTTRLGAFAHPQNGQRCITDCDTASRKDTPLQRFR